MGSKISLSAIFKEHDSSLKLENGKYSGTDKLCFVTLPLLIAVSCVFIFGIPNDRLVTIFSTILSVFIGMFLNLLALLVSFSKDNSAVKDKKNRKKLLKETFSNVSYTIVISIFSLVFLLLSSIKFTLFDVLIISIDSSYIENLFNIQDELIKRINLVSYLTIIASFCFYLLFSKVLITTLMIVKRIYRFFNVEITSNINDSVDSKVSQYTSSESNDKQK